MPSRSIVFGARGDRAGWRFLSVRPRGAPPRVLVGIQRCPRPEHRRRPSLHDVARGCVQGGAGGHKSTRENVERHDDLGRRDAPERPSHHIRYLRESADLARAAVPSHGPPRLWADERQSNAAAFAELDVSQREFCTNAHRDLPSQDLCARPLITALQAASIFQKEYLKQRPSNALVEPKLQTPDPNVVPRTKTGHSDG